MRSFSRNTGIRGRARAAAIGMACIAVGAAFGPTLATAATSFKEVFVTNGDDSPVPTKAIGSTQVKGTVNVGNTPSIRVANDQPIPVAPVGGADAGETPVTHRFSFDFGGGYHAFGEPYTVPQGKRLTIEYVTFGEDFSSTNVTSLELLVAGASYAFVVERIPGGASAVSQPTKIVADAGQTVDMLINIDRQLANTFMRGVWVGTLTEV